MISRFRKKDENNSNTLNKSRENNKKKYFVIQSLKEFEDVICSSETDLVVSGMVGIAGLIPVHFAIQKGKKVLLANKESYVVAGEYLNNLCKETGAIIFPIDSAHSAIPQCLNNKGNNFTIHLIVKISPILFLPLFL